MNNENNFEGFQTNTMGGRIYAVILWNGKNCNQFALENGISDTVVYQWIHDDHRPKLDYIDLMAEELHVSKYYLLDGKMDDGDVEEGFPEFTVVFDENRGDKAMCQDYLIKYWREVNKQQLNSNPKTQQR